MTVMSVLHLAEGFMASSAGGMTKLLLNGSHIPSPKVYVNLQMTRKVDKTSKVTGLRFASRAEIAWKTWSSQWNAGDLAAPVDTNIVSVTLHGVTILSQLKCAFG